MTSHSSTSNTTHRAWNPSLTTALLLMVPFDFMASLAMDVYLPVIPQMPRELGTSPFLVQLTLSIYLLILGLGQLVFGPLSDRFGRRPILLCGSATYAIASFCLAATNDGGLFLALRMIQAVGASAALVATFATVRDVFGGRPESTTLYGLLSSMLAIVPAAGPVLGAVLAHALGWRSIFVALGTVAAIAFLHALIRWRESLPSGRTVSGVGALQILRTRTFWVYTLGFSTAMGGFFVFFSVSPGVLIDGAGYSQVGFSLVFATVALVMMATSALTRRRVAAWGTARCFHRGVVLMLTGSGIMALCATMTTPGFASFVVPMWIIAAGIVLVVSVAANGALEGFDQTAGTAVALYYAVQGVVVAVVASMAIGILDRATPWPVVGFCSAMGAISLISLKRMWALGIR